MRIIKNEYKSFLDDIEKNIKNKEDLEYIKERFAKFIDIVLEQIEYIIDYKEEEIQKLEEAQKDMIKKFEYGQKIIDDKMEKMQQVIDNIEKDIYSEDGFDFEIVCPYCNYEFIIDVDENRTEIECPECNNIIELDWSGDPENDDIEPNSSDCLKNGHCSTCHGCASDGVSDEEDDGEQYEQKEDEQNNDDDM